jgi:hypothetical protein
MTSQFIDTAPVEIDSLGETFYLSKCHRAYTYTVGKQVQTLTVTDENQVSRTKTYTYNGDGLVLTESPWVR